MLPVATKIGVYCDELLPDNKVETEEQGPGILREWIEQLICGGGDTSIISQEAPTRHQQPS